jgi:hypothetical protein
LRFSLPIVSEFRLPDILSQEQVHLFAEHQNPKHKLIIGLFYGTRMRLDYGNGIHRPQEFQIKSWAARQQRPIHALPRSWAKWKPITDTTAPSTRDTSGSASQRAYSRRRAQGHERQRTRAVGFHSFFGILLHLLDQGRHSTTIKELWDIQDGTMIYFLQQRNAPHFVRLWIFLN